jgi:ribosomal 50S subunit-recycling heat shock protein
MRHSKKDAVRLNKFISDAGFCSRREADELILQERVMVNGKVAEPGDKVFKTDFVRIDGEPLRIIPKVVVEAKMPEFLSKRVSRNTGGAIKRKPKPAKDSNLDVKKEEKPADKVKAKVGAKPSSKKSHQAAEKPKASAAKKWFSGRKK